MLPRLGRSDVPPKPPKGQYFVDRAHMLSWQGDTTLDHGLARLAAEMDWHLYALTVPSLGKPGVEQYADAVVKRWGLDGQAKTSLLLLSTGEDTATLWTSPDLNDSLPEYARDLVLKQAIVPALKHGQDSIALYGGLPRLWGWMRFTRFKGMSIGIFRSMMITPVGFDDASVQDYAYLFSSQEKEALLRQTAAQMRHDSIGVMVVTVATLGGLDEKEYALNMARLSSYGSAYQGKQHGFMLILVAEQERRIRICTEFSPVLTDPQAQGIIDSILTPAFRKQQYYAGIHQALNRLHHLQRINLDSIRKELASTQRRDKWQPWIIIGLALAFCCSIPFWGHYVRESPRPWYGRQRSSSYFGGGGSGSSGSGGSSWGGGGASGSW